MKSKLIIPIIQLILVVIILFYYIYYGFVAPNPYGLGDALRITIALIIFSIMGIAFKYFLYRKFYWKLLLPIVIALLPLLFLVLRKLI